MCTQYELCGCSGPAGVKHSTAMILDEHPDNSDVCMSRIPNTDVMATSLEHKYCRCECLLFSSDQLLFMCHQFTPEVVS